MVHPCPKLCKECLCYKCKLICAFCSLERCPQRSIFDLQESGICIARHFQEADFPVIRPEVNNGAQLAF